MKDMEDIEEGMMVVLGRLPSEKSVKIKKRRREWKKILEIAGTRT